MNNRLKLSKGIRNKVLYILSAFKTKKHFIRLFFRNSIKYKMNFRIYIRNDAISNTIKIKLIT
jgi:hypothetical protein